METGARIIAAGNDVTLVIDREGIIRDVAVGSTDLGNDPFAGWIDQPFVDTVSPDSRTKVQEMLQDAASRSTPRWRQVNHPGGRGHVPVRYLALEAGGDGRVIAVGREMGAAVQLQQRLIQAQQAMERDYVRLRQTEQRYRLLFDLSAEAVLVVDAQSRRILQANPAAHMLLGQKPDALPGQSLVPLFHPDEQDGLLQHLGVVISGASARRRDMHLPDGTSVTLAASLFRQDRSAQLLVRLTPELHEPIRTDTPSLVLRDVVERIPDAFVLADRALTVQAVNAAFLDLTHLPREDQAVGEKLDQWLGRPGIDLDLVVGQLRTDGIVRNFETVVRSRLGDMEDVEISAVMVERDGEPQFGFVIRSTARRLGRTESSADMPRSVEQLTELVGRVALKDIVRESTDLIERLCIEAALRFTSNNRASAAEILGLSRQSLYSKLHRHGIANPGFDADE